MKRILTLDFPLFLQLRVKETNDELEKERDNLNTEISKLKLGGSEENETLRKSNQELEDKLQGRSEELVEAKEKLQAHDQAAKRAIAALQKEMALRVDQVSSYKYLFQSHSLPQSHSVVHSFVQSL